MSRRKLISDEIRDAINNSGKTHLQICKEIELVQPAMSKFMTGRAGLPMSVLERLADVLDLHIVVGKPPKATDDAAKAGPRKKAR